MVTLRAPDGANKKTRRQLDYNTISHHIGKSSQQVELSSMSWIIQSGLFAALHWIDPRWLIEYCMWNYSIMDLLLNYSIRVFCCTALNWSEMINWILHVELLWNYSIRIVCCTALNWSKMINWMLNVELIKYGIIVELFNQDCLLHCTELIQED